MIGKHFRALAEALKYNRPEPNWENKFIQWQGDCREIADVCRSFNGTFDRERFYRACGLTNEEGR
jgi:hypothetical protein